MKNPNNIFKRLKQYLVRRWSEEDTPGGEPRFQVALFGKDIAVFFLLPIFAVLIYSFATGRKPEARKNSSSNEMARDRYSQDGSKSQIIEFRVSGLGKSGGIVARRSPGSLVRVRLLNVIETYGTTPVHAQVVDTGLGNGMLGGTLIGDATPDTNFERISINFHFARDPNRENVALPIVARALSLDGTFGLVATKKEGFFTRSVLGSAGSASQEVQGKMGSSGDFGQILLKALTAGLVQEFGTETQVEKNRSQVLSLAPGTEFFAELTDFFPGGAK